MAQRQRTPPTRPARLRSVLLGLVALALGACVSAPSRDREAPLRPAVWPGPPDPPRFAFEALLRSQADIRGGNGQDALRRRLTGDTSDQVPAFEKVGAVAATQGRIYAADTVKRRIVVFDAPRRKVFVFGLRSPGELLKPLALALDGAGNVYVADAGRRRILVYDPLGLHLKTLGDSEDLGRPTGVAVNGDGSRIYVVDRADNDSDRHRVLVLAGDGRRLGEFGRRGNGPGEFNIPVQAAVGPDGRVYVLDAGNFRVQAFTPDGQFLQAFGGNGTAVGSFARPRGLAVDRDGRIYVSDAFFGNFQIFDRAGELLLAIGQLGQRDAPGHYGLISGLAVDETGRIYVADQLFNKIEVIRPLAAPGPPQDRNGEGGKTMGGTFRGLGVCLLLLAASLALADVDLPTKFSNMGSVANTRHNLTQRQMSGGGPSGAVMDPYRSNYGGVCVYCHTPHGANGAVKLPLWNRTLKTTTYTTYAALNTSSLTQAVAQPGVNSLACLSCHDGQVAVDSIINMPGAGRYDSNQMTGQNNTFLNTWSNPSGTGPFAHAKLTECMACHAAGAGIVGTGATDFTVFNIGTDLRNDHPIGVTYPTGAAAADFQTLGGTRDNIKFLDLNGNGRPDKNEVRVFDSGEGHKVECASCHDPHGVPSGGTGTAFNASFLRVTADGSSICLSCHVK